MSNIIAFQRPVNGIKVEQRADDGYMNATAMASAHLKDISDWLALDSTLRIVTALAKRLDIEINSGISPNSAKTRVSALFPSLVSVRRGSPANGGGTWIHPKLGVNCAQWCNEEFALLVADWVEEWMLTGVNPVKIDPDEQYRLWQERYDIRVELRDVLRVELMNAVIAYAERHGLGARCLCIDTHDEMNKRIQGSSASGIRELGGLPLGDLIRDYYGASPLVDYSAINKIATNSIEDKDIHPVTAVKEACEGYFGVSYTPRPVILLENIHSQGKRLQAATRLRRLKAGIQLNLLDEVS